MQVGAKEVSTDRVIGLNIKRITNVLLNRWGGGRRQRQHAFDAKVSRHHGQLQVVGAKIVPPLTDAMRFVDRKQRDFDSLHRATKSLVEKTLRCDV